MLWQYECIPCERYFLSENVNTYECPECEMPLRVVTTHQSVCVAWLGYNRIKNYLGVFSTLEQAKEKFLEAGCVVRNGRMIVTEAFQNWLATNAYECRDVYSVMGNPILEEWTISFDLIPLDCVYKGYDDD